MASDTARGAAFEATARSWVAHLRAGGTTPWADWATAPVAAPSSSAAGSLPGAAQLELLRRLNQLGPVPHLVDHVLTRPGPGRGWVHLPLPWPPARPTAPAAEVRRVAVGVLADLTAGLPLSEVGPGRRHRRPGRRRRAGRGAPTFVLEGLPLTLSALRGELASAGLTEHRPRTGWFSLRPRPDDVPDRVLVVAGPVDEALHEAWASRVLGGSNRSWGGFVGSWSSRGALPPSADLRRALDHWVPQVGPDRVHVLVAPRGEADELADRVEELLGHRPDAARLSVTQVAPGPALLDLLRRVDQVLPFLLPEDRRPAARAALRALLSEEHHGPQWIGLPRRRRGWAARRGVRLIEAVRESGVVVHGELEALASLAPAARGVRAVDTVAAAVRMIHRIEDLRAPETGAAGEGTGR